MAPLCADPRQIVIAFDEQQRLELLKLIDDVILYMTSQLHATADELGSLSDESDPDDGAVTSSKKPEEQAASGQTSQDAKSGVQADDEASKPKPSSSTFDAGKLVESMKGVKISAPWKSNSDEPSAATKKTEDIQMGALKYMVDWQKEFMPRMEEIIRVKDNDKIITERKTRQETLMQEKPSPNIDANQDENESDDLVSLQGLYPPMPSTLAKFSRYDRQECLSCILLLLLSTGKYSAHSRTMVLYLASSLQLPQSFVNHEEREIAKSLMESSTADKTEKESMSAEAETAKRQNENKFSRYWKVGLASVAGATIIGVTGGLAAPLVAGALGGILGGVGLGGVASFLGLFWMNGALVGALFGAYGAKMTGSMMDKYAKEVEDFRFIPLEGKGSEEVDQNKDGRRLRVTIGINGWLNSEDDITVPWKVLNNESEVFALRYEMQTLLSLGTALQDLVQSFAWKALKSEIIKRTVLATLWAALWPIQVMALASNVDNPFNRASNRSKKAGRLLADALINKVQGERPVTLVGYSLGAVAIHACLQSLAERKAFGLIDNVVVIGTPAPSDPAHWRTLRTVVSGKIFNVYSENDMVLGFVYRMHSLAMGVAGLQAIDSVAGVKNLDLSESVSGHLRYPSLTGEILYECGFAGVRAGGKIEKDDVIKLKEDYAAGRIADLDDQGKEVIQSPKLEEHATTLAPSEAENEK